ncbi:unnamed protein product [Rhizoctonia solani]|uniref:Uncharacterized protein n=1 Tax=Rhizoctonia solani TaxID=456999 RepID=A0A8H3H7M6_9AGAM|nr:unnamed protein product [Rhizoctonia solani]
MLVLPVGKDLVDLVEAGHAQLELAKGLTVLLGTVLPVFLFHPSPGPSVRINFVSISKLSLTKSGLYFRSAIDVVSGVLIFRCWALYNNRHVLWILFIGLAGAATSTIVFTNRIMREIIVLPQISVPGVLSGCTVIVPTSMWMGLIPTTIFESSLFILTLWKIGMMRDYIGTTRLSRRLAEHGVAYFAIRVVMITFACIGGSVRTIQIATNASGLLTSISSVVCSRMMFSLHELNSKPREGMTSITSDDDIYSFPEFAIPLESLDISSPTPDSRGKVI